MMLSCWSIIYPRAETIFTFISKTIIGNLILFLTAWKIIYKAFASLQLIIVVNLRYQFNARVLLKNWATFDSHYCLSKPNMEMRKMIFHTYHFSAFSNTGMSPFLSSKNDHESFIHGMRVENEKCSFQCLETLKNGVYEISKVTHPIRGDCESFLYKQQFKRSPNKKMKKNWRAVLLI